MIPNIVKIYFSGELHGQYPIVKDGKLVDIGRKFLANGKIYTLKFRTKDVEDYADKLTKQDKSLRISGLMNRKTYVISVLSIWRNNALDKLHQKNARNARLGRIKIDNINNVVEDKAFTGAHRSGNAAALTLVQHHSRRTIYRHSYHKPKY